MKSGTLYPRTLERIRDRVRERRYVVTLHALDELEDDGFSVLDMERVVLTGEIEERQRDRATREWKYLIRGSTADGRPMVVVGKLGSAGKLVVVTAWANGEQAEM